MMETETVAALSQQISSYSTGVNLMLDFEAEFAAFLNRDFPDIGGRVRRRSSTSSVASRRILEVGVDGTVQASDLSYDALCTLSGRSSLEHLTTLTMAVSCSNSTDNLSILSTCLRSLTTLKLDYSNIRTLRVLSDELPSLKTLSVCSCGLEDLDGITYTPNLLSLTAADNRIRDALPITELRRINTVDLENNAFADYGSISFLFICPKLENLVLRGNPISNDEDYRHTIFRILPMLKNLDVILTPRTPRTFCRKDETNDGDDGADNSAAPVVSNVPKELEDVLDPELMGRPQKVEDKDPLEDEILQKFLKQESEESEEAKEESICNEEATNDENLEEENPSEVLTDNEGSSFEEDDSSPQDDENSNKNEDVDVDVDVDVNAEADEESDVKDDEATEEIVEEPIQAEENVQSEEKTEAVPDNNPKYETVAVTREIQEVKEIKSSPARSYYESGSKLLDRRKSADPAKIRDFSDLDVEGTCLSATTFATAPNLGKLLANDRAKPAAALSRPDSSMSISSVATTSCSMSVSESDSGIDFFVKPISRQTSTYNVTESHGARGTYEALPKLGERKGIGLQCLPTETPSKRTKKTDEAKLLRTNSDLSGLLTTQGDIEIEDFDVDL